MVIFYFAFAGMLTFTNIFNVIIPKKTGYVLAAVLFLYGIFRTYRFIKIKK